MVKLLGMGLNLKREPDSRRTKKMKIALKFFLIFFIFSTLTIGLFSLFSSFYYSKILIDKEFLSFQSLTASFLAQVENEIHVMDDVSINIFYSSIASDDFAQYMENSVNQQDDMSNMLDIFIALNGANFALPLIALYSESGEKFTMSTYFYIDDVDLSALDWIQEADANRYHKVLSMPYASNIMQHSQAVAPYYISLYRALRNSDGADIGYVETTQYAKDIFKSIRTHQRQIDDSLEVYVYNQNGELIFPYENVQIGRDQQDYYFSIASPEKPARIFPNVQRGRRELIYSQTSSFTDWTYICVQGKAHVLQPVMSTVKIIIIATAIMLVIVTLVSLYISSSITKPIRKLLRSIHATNIDTLSAEKKSLQSDYDEFDDLNDAFNNMNEKLKISMDELLHAKHRETEAHFLALQSQINPHFFYNSLSSVIALIEEHRDAEVIQFCNELSRFMRYTTYPDSGLVSLETELNNIDKFLYCMKVRYQSSLNYSIFIDEDLRNIQIPKLIVQPLIENAVKYGTNCTPPWHISINVRSDGEKWAISVSDSGPGFCEDALREFDAKKEAWRSAISSNYEDREGMGLINVYARWRIYSGNRFYFAIDSAQTGCTVSIGQLIKGQRSE